MPGIGASPCVMCGGKRITFKNGVTAPRAELRALFPAKEQHSPVVIEIPGRRFEVYRSEATFIEYFVNLYPFKNKSAAADNIRIIADGIGKWTKETVVYREKFWEEILPRLAEIAREQDRDLDESFMRLATVARFHDVSGKKVNLHASQISKSIFGKDKYFLFESIADHPEAFGNIFSRPLMRIASTLRYIAKFSCRLFLYLMFELPEMVQELTKLTVRGEAEIREVEGELQLVLGEEKVPEKRMSRMRREIRDSLKRVDQQVRERADYQALLPEERAGLFFNARLEMLKKYSHLGLVRIACIYLRDYIYSRLGGSHRDIHNKMFEAARENMQLIYDEMSNLSNVLAMAAHAVAQEKTEAEFGSPLKEFDLPTDLKAALPELQAAHKTMRRREDHLVSKSLEIALIHRLLLIHRTDLEKVMLEEAKGGRQDVSLEVVGRIWQSLSETEKISLAESFTDSERISAAEVLANYLRGIYRYLRTSRFAFLLSGANARKEFPSFDYDAFFFYEEEGKTTMGASNTDYFEALVNNIEKAINSIDHDGGTWPFPFRKPKPGRGRLEVFPLNWLSEKLAAGGLTTHLAAQPFQELAVVSGDRRFAAQAVEDIYAVAYHPKIAPVSIFMLTYLQRHPPVQPWSFEDMGQDIWVGPPSTAINIKFDWGGLRDMTRLLWTYKLHKNCREAGVFEVLKKMAEEYPEEISHLVDSYEFIMNLRIRLDLDIGRNSKELPEGLGLLRFANLLGYYGGDALERFEADLERHRTVVRSAKQLMERIVDFEQIERLGRQVFQAHDIKRYLE